MKRGFTCFTIFLILCSSSAFAATPYSSAAGYHPLQQVTTDQTGTTSVDANSNGIIDTADSTGTFTGDSVGSGTTDVTFKIKGGTNLWSAIDFYDGSGAYWGMGKNKLSGDGDFYIDKSGVGGRRALTIDRATLNVGLDTTNPQAKLDVNGDVKIGGDTGTSRTNNLLKIAGDASDKGIQLYADDYFDDNTWGTRFWKEHHGNGIGLRVDTQYTSTWYPSIYIGHGQQAADPFFGVFGGATVGSGYTTVNSPPANGLIVEGSVGIGTPSPGSKLDVVGIITSTGLTVSSGTVSLPANQIDSSEITDGAVTSTDISDTTIATADIADGAVTSAKVNFNYAGSSSKGGAATSATALAANPTDCAAGEAPTSIDASGNFAGCTAYLTTDGDSSATNEIQNLGTSGTTITLSGSTPLSITVPYATNAGTLNGVQFNGLYPGWVGAGYYHLGSWAGNAWGPAVLVDRARYSDTTQGGTAFSDWPDYADRAGTADTLRNVASSGPHGAGYYHIGTWGGGYTSAGSILVNGAQYAETAGYASTANFWDGYDTSSGWDLDASNDITTSNIGSQSVASAGNAGTVGGLGTGSFRQFNTWQYNHYSGTDGAEYATKYFDANNGGYYTAPASTSVLNNVNFNSLSPSTGNSPNSVYSHYGIYEEPGAWNGGAIRGYPYPDLVLAYHTGMSYVAYYGYGGHRFYTGYTPDATPTTLSFSVGEGDGNTRVYGNLYTTGYTGIGTPNPGNKLDVVSSASNAAGIRVYGGSSVGTAHDRNGQIIVGASPSSPGYYGSLTYNYYTDELFFDKNPASGKMYFRMGTANSLTIDASSNVGILGSVTASSFSGAGTGLTGTAASLTAGNANALNGVGISSFTRKDSVYQFLKPFYEYGSYLTSETPDTLKNQMGGGGLRVDFMHPSYTGNGDWNHVITYSGYNRYGMGQMAFNYYSSTPGMRIRMDNSHGNSWTGWANVITNPGSGTTNKLTKWTSTTSIGDSIITDTGSAVGIGTTPGNPLDVQGAIRSLGASQQGGILKLEGAITTNGNNNGKITFSNLNTFGGPPVAEIGTLSETDGYNFGGTAGAGIYFSSKPDGGAIGERMRILGNGNVGIGTTNPQAKLHVAGVIQSTSNINAQGSFYSSGGSDGGANLGMYGSLTSGTIAAPTLYFNTGADFSRTTKMTINSGGNVGIGTTSPQAKLHVVDGMYVYGSGDANGDGTIALADAIKINGWLAGTTILTSAEYARADINGDGSVTMLDSELILKYTVGLITLDQARHSIGKQIADSAISTKYDGNVGIGTTNPQAKLHVAGVIQSTSNINAQGSFYSSGGSDAGANLGMYGSLTSGTIAAPTLYFNTGSDFGRSTKMTILSGGNVGIGTASPTNKLYVNGGTTINGGLSVNYINSQNSVTGGLDGVSLYGIYGAGTTGVYAAGTNYGVKAGGSLYDFYAQGTGVDYGTASSIRWKTNVTTLIGALDTIIKLRGVSYDWDEAHGGKHAIGFIGEEIGKYYPEIVSFDSNSTDPSYYVTGMDYSKMTPVLLEATKELKLEKDVQVAELQQKIETQQQAIDSQQNKIDAQQQSIKELQQQVNELLQK